MSVFFASILTLSCSGLSNSNCFNFSVCNSNGMDKFLSENKDFYNTWKNAIDVEVLLAYANNDIDIVLLPDNEITKGGIKFFFGLENRRKLVFENNVLTDFKTGETLRRFTASNVQVIPSNFLVEISEGNGVEHFINETTDGVFLDGTIINGTEEKIYFPDFHEYKYPTLMKVLYHEIMFAIIDGVPQARLYDYHNRTIWFRDIAYVGLFLESINRTFLIENFTNHISRLYDNSNIFGGVNEVDNLGQILYLQSLVKSPNTSLINDVIAEARRIRDDNGNLIGLTDGKKSAVYQNGWLIWSLKRLGLPEIASEFNSHSNIDEDNYSKLLWFTLKEKNIQWHKPRNKPLTLPDLNKSRRSKEQKPTYTNVSWHNKFPYIYIAKDHFRMLSGRKYRNPVLTQVVYPITWGDNTRPHIWHGVELFMYLKEILCV